MNRVLLVAVVCVVGSLPLRGQEFPKVTEEGKQALAKLIAECQKTGALKEILDPRTRKARLQADVEKLRVVVKKQRALLTPALRDALVDRSQEPALVTLLGEVGEETKDDQARAFGRYLLAEHLQQSSQLRQARGLFQEAAELFASCKLRHWRATALANLGVVCRSQGDLPAARKHTEQALALQRKLFGEQHPAVANSLNNLGVVCREQGDLAAARKHIEQALALRRKLFGEQHPDVANSLASLGWLCHARGDLPAARKLFEQALALHRKLHGEQHADAAHSLNSLGEVCRAQGDLPAARKYQEQALALYRKLYKGDQHPYVATSLNDLGLVCRAQGDLPAARKHHEQALAIRRRLFGDRHPAVATSLNNLGAVCHTQGDLAAARKHYEQALALFRRIHGEQHLAVAVSLNNLGNVCRAQGDLAAALAHWSEAVQACRLPGTQLVNPDQLQATHLLLTPITVRALRNRAWGLETSLGARPAVGQVRRCAHAYTLAADVLDRLRGEALQTEEARLQRGAEYSNLVVNRVRMAGKLFELSGDPADLAVAVTGVEHGRACVFLESFGRSRLPDLGGIDPDLRRQERTLLDALADLDRRLQKEQNKTLAQRDADLAARLFDQVKQKN
jgi:tetratricopeptide (TPR) repeat protein